MVARQIKLVGIVIGMVVSLGVTGCGSATNSVNESKSALVTDPGDTGTKASGGGVTVTNVYSEPKQLSVGDLMYVDLEKSAFSSLDFSGVNSTAEFTLILANTAADKGSVTVQMSGDISDPDLNLAKSLDIAAEDENDIGNIPTDITEKLHETLRFQEKDLESLDLLPEQPSVGKSIGSISPDSSAPVAVGDTRPFKVLASLSSSTSTVSVTAVAECVGSNVAFYVDNRVTNEMLSSTDVADLCNKFDATVGKEQALFGSLSDVNQDGKVIVLLTPQVNHLGALGGGIVTGFFNATDLYPNSSTNLTSNNMEILYVMVPDPQGEYGSVISKKFALSNLLPAVLPHELQHAISYNQHVFINKGSAEEAWLNEGLSHLAEDMFGENQENPSRYAMYLQNPQGYSLVAGRSPGLAARGGAYLFLRFLYEQSEEGNKFLSRIDQTSLTGISNIEKAFSGRSSDFDQFGEFFLRWNIALAVSDAGVTKDSHYTYRSRVKDASTGNWSGVCLRCNTEDGRGTVLSGVPLKAYSGAQSAVTAQSAARFYKVSTVKDKLSFNAISGGTGYGILIRTK